MSDFKKHIDLTATYNRWAHQKLIYFFSDFEDDDLHKNMGNSYASLRETFLHIWTAEYIWHKRLIGETTKNTPDNMFSGANTEMWEGLLMTNDALTDYTYSLKAENMNEICNYETSEGAKYSQPRVHILTHVFNHSTYHRGQLITMSRQLKPDTAPPQTDLIHYLRKYA